MKIGVSGYVNQEIKKLFTVGFTVGQSRTVIESRGIKLDTNIMEYTVYVLLKTRYCLFLNDF